MRTNSIVLASREEEWEALLSWVEAFAQSEGYSSDFLSELLCAMKEAFVNALHHGNRHDERLPVTVMMTALGMDAIKVLIVEVRDCGNGFCLEDISDPTEEQFLHCSSGRGMYIIKSIAEVDGIECHDDGCSLKLRFAPF
ncbi:MAG: ATP-binding protein [Candidatus Chlorobium antarcticum]|jgi:anti-sigma regulatory factor (Ser/Thr protein kinase)|nr:ATP-binding protein [Candidatus Chlorobium antarcticum]